MKNFELENAELKSLNNSEMGEIDGGMEIDWQRVRDIATGIAIGVLIVLL